MHHHWITETRRKPAAKHFFRDLIKIKYFKVQWWSPVLNSLQIGPSGMPVAEFWASIFLNLHGLSGSLPALWQGSPCCSFSHTGMSEADPVILSRFTHPGPGLLLSLTTKAAVSCARRTQPALPASQEAWEDPGLLGGCSVPAPFVWAQPCVPLLRGDKNCGCPCGGVVPGHCRDQGEQDEGRRKGEGGGCCHTAHFSTGSLLPSCTPQGTAHTLLLAPELCTVILPPSLSHTPG